MSPLCRLSQQSERCGRPLSVKTFEDIPVAISSVMVTLFHPEQVFNSITAMTKMPNATDEASITVKKK